MRITIDIDDDRSIPLLWSVLKGLYFLNVMPRRIRRTERGYHIIYKGLEMNEEDSMKYRLAIGDDKNRVHLDLGGNRLTNVLFTFKTTTCRSYIHPAWFSRVMHIKSPSPNFDVCPFCLKMVKESSKIWEEDRKEIEIVHEDGTKCIFPLRRREGIGLRLLKSIGITIV